MKRIAHTPRTNLDTIAEGYGFGFTVIDGKTYWDESKYYEFTLKQIEQDIEDPTNELHEMIMEAAGTVIESDELMRKFAIPEDAWGKIRASWKNDEPMLYGRMDLCYDGKSPAKLYEANYDTPTALFEAAVFQWDWLESQFRRLTSSTRSTRSWSAAGTMSVTSTRPMICTSRASRNRSRTRSPSSI